MKRIPLAVVLALVPLALLFALKGCSKRPVRTEDDDPERVGKPATHRENALAGLRKTSARYNAVAVAEVAGRSHTASERDRGTTWYKEDPPFLAGPREVVEELNKYLMAEKPDLKLGPSERELLQNQFHLNPEELAEVESQVFTML